MLSNILKIVQGLKKDYRDVRLYWLLWVSAALCRILGGCTWA